MRTSLPLLFFLAACTGSLSDDQRKKLRENMESGEIKKVSEAALTEASFAYGRRVMAILEERDKSLANDKLIDSLQKAFNVKIISLRPGDSAQLEVENRIIEAYMEGVGEVTLSDDIQKIGYDSVLYSKPVLLERPDGSLEFKKAIGIHIPVKEIILSIKD